MLILFEEFNSVGAKNFSPVHKGNGFISCFVENLINHRH